MLLGQVRPIELGLGHDLETQADRRSDVGELLDAPPEHEDPRVCVRQERRQQDDEEVDNVNKACLERVDHHAQTRLRAEGDEEAEHQQEVVEGHDQAVPRADVGDRSGRVMQIHAQCVELGGVVLLAGCSDLGHISGDGARQHGDVLVAEHDSPTDADDRPLQHEPTSEHLLQKGALPQARDHAGEFEYRDDKQHEAKQTVRRHADHARVGFQEDRVQRKFGENVACAAVGKRQLVRLEARAAELVVQHKDAHRNVFRLGVKPAVLPHVVETLLNERITHVRREYGPEDARLLDPGTHLAPRQFVAVFGTYPPESSPSVLLNDVERLVVQVRAVFQSHLGCVEHIIGCLWWCDPRNDIQGPILIKLHEVFAETGCIYRIIRKAICVRGNTRAVRAQLLDGAFLLQEQRALHVVEGQNAAPSVLVLDIPACIVCLAEHDWEERAIQPRPSVLERLDMFNGFAKGHAQA
mmetsp:Transcript_68872/g.211213  ORF Transcript_68872/g.211213 Transcript_68872/m.211213 type:complete len:467 (+) Transcript_68872:745-2145(+)